MGIINPINMTTAQKAIATTIARAITLLTADGYTINPYANEPGKYWVARPEDDKRPLRKGETLWNDVDILNQDCTCECFKHHGTCKHLIAANKAIAEAARLMGPMLPAQTAFTRCKRIADMTPEEKRRQIAADFG